MPHTIERLIAIMDELREKCPWDKKQTIHTLRKYSIEETYELVDAINNEDWQGIKEELGDLLLHILFYTKIATEQKHFTFDDVVNSICDKLILRHPHIYGDGNMEGLNEVTNEEDVRANWEKLKLKEGKKSILSGVPQSLPSLVKAIRLQEKTKSVGFEWETAAQVYDKVKEEITELEEVVLANDTNKIEDELGDVFFSLINYARFLEIDADAALERTNKKFIRRFQAIETIAQENNKSVHDLSLQEMDEIWNRVKLQEK
jgi:MazG family protein